MIQECKYCKTLLTLTQQHYHQYLCPSQQFLKQMSQLKFLLSNAKISSQQFSQIKEILKLNFKVIYKDDLISNNKLFNDSFEKQELIGEDIFFMNSNVSNYFEDNIGNQVCNLSTFQEKTENPNESFHSSHSEFFDYISQIDNQIQDSSIIVKKEIFTISELLQNLSFKEEYSSRSPKTLEMNQNNKVNCQMCKKQFKNTKTLKKHQKNIHKHTIVISTNLNQQEIQLEAAL